MMLATRVGAGIAAEIGSMKVTEQIDALRMSGVLPIDYLIVPRFIASLVMTLMLSTLGGARHVRRRRAHRAVLVRRQPDTCSSISRCSRPRHLVLMRRQGASPTAPRFRSSPGFCGLRARGSSEGVGWATTAAVIGCSFAVIVLDFVISAAALFLTRR